MKTTETLSHKFGPGLKRVRHRISGLARSMRGRKDQRDLSMADTDQNATGAAAAVQSAKDADDRTAGAPAELGGQG